MAQRKLEFDNPRLVAQLFGPSGSNVHLLAEKTGASIETRGNEATISGEQDQLELVAEVLHQLYGILKSGQGIYPQDVDCACRILSREPGADVKKIFNETVYMAGGKRKITPKTLGQREYIDAIRENDLTIGIGPAGTGKTYMAVAMAVAALMSKSVKRIVLTRPAVEAGEKLGFLPGDLVEKVNPYLRPLYDALNDMLDFERVQELLVSGAIEVAPLAFMRGRTLNDAFVILDEAQNTTPEQMKMFLTRLGFGSRAVVTGDVTQIDLPTHQKSGLIQARLILKDVPGIGLVTFGDDDVIRHPLVGRIVQAYEKYEHGT